VEPIAHVFVQKCVVGSPIVEHSFADWVLLQSERLAQNFPMPSSLPVSPGLPHVELNASGAASGFDSPPPPPQAASITTKVAISCALIAATMRLASSSSQQNRWLCPPNSARVTSG
jgi:hypothetical protein